MKMPEVIAQFTFRDAEDGFWIDIKANGEPHSSVGPFDTAGERQRAYDDMLEMSRRFGAQDLPPRPQ